MNQQSTQKTTEVAPVWNPNTRKATEYTVFDIYRAADTFSYGKIKVNDKVVDVHFSQSHNMWSR